MELVTVKIFTDQENELYGGEFIGNNPIKDKVVIEQDFSTGKVRDHVSMNRVLYIELPDNIKGEVTLINKLLVKKPLYIDTISSEFFDEGYFDYDRTTKLLREYLSNFYYKILAVNTIMEFKDYMHNRDRVLFELVNDDIPSYISVEDLKSLISRILRGRGINVIRTEDDETSYLLIENINSKSTKYLSNILSKQNPIDIDIFRIHLKDIVDTITTTEYKNLFYEFIKPREEVQMMINSISSICNSINSEEFQYYVLGRLKQLYNIFKSELKLLLEFNGFSSEIVYEDTLHIKNDVLSLFNLCEDKCIHVENYRLTAEIFTDVIVDTKKFTEESDIKGESTVSVCTNITSSVSSLYSDIVKLYFDGSNVCICNPGGDDILW